MAKRRKKRRLKFPFFLIFIFIFGSILTLFYFFNNPPKITLKERLEKIGYQENVIEVLLKLEENEVEMISYEPKNEFIESLVLEDEFLLEHFQEYLNYYNEKKDTVSNTLEKINSKLVSSTDDETTKNLKNGKYYVPDNLDRYLEYINNYPNLSIETVISYVNSNLDYAYYTNVESTDLSKNNLMIVNKYYNLSSTYVPENLVLMESTYMGNGKYLDATAYEAYKKLYDDAKKEGLYLSIASAYRSYSYQQGLYNNYVIRDGVTAADTYSARAGHSEHQTGLAFDICTTRCKDLGDFEDSNEFYWMKENAHKYGFILRYPENGVKITGYMYEPWHYRYVGIDAAKIIYENNLTYEEYYAYYIEVNE